MASASAELHEDPQHLSPMTIERHRAVVSLMEELEAIDWYDQRIDATQDSSLKEILTYNRDEEKEHAALILEWLRRHDPKLSTELKARLFQEGGIKVADLEDLPPSEKRGPSSDDEGASLNIGSLKGRSTL